MTTSNTDINNICNQFKISKEDEIKFNKLRDEIATLGQQIIALNETRFVAINKMQELLDKYTIDQKIVNNFINNVEKYPTTTIINDKHKTAPKAVVDESEPAEESRSKKVVKKKPVTKTPKKSGAAAMKIEDEEEPEAETHDEPEPEPEKEPEIQEETEETVETRDETEQETQETQENEEENQETEEDKPVKKTVKKAPVKKATTAKKAPVKKATTAKKVPAKKTTTTKKVPAKNSD